MDGNIVKEIEKIVHDGITVVGKDGIEYSSHRLIPVQDDRKISRIALSTLTGFKDYIVGNFDKLEKEKMFVVVQSYESVDLFLCADNKTKIRQHPLSVELDRNGKNFPFGMFIPVEELIIKLSSFFQKTDALTKIMQYVSKLTISETVKTEDDGVSQQATVKKSISGAFKEIETAPSRVILKPIRTFIEIEQPESEFIFRLKSNGAGIPLCAIFEADGGAWKCEAMKKIKEWLKETIQSISVIA